MTVNTLCFIYITLSNVACFTIIKNIVNTDKYCDIWIRDQLYLVDSLNKFEWCVSDL